MTESTDVAALTATIAQLRESIAYLTRRGAELEAERDALERRVRTLEQERAKARTQAFVNAARIADSFAYDPADPAWSRATARAIAARLRARAAVGVPPQDGE